MNVEKKKSDFEIVSFCALYEQKKKGGRNHFFETKKPLFAKAFAGKMDFPEMLSFQNKKTKAEPKLI
jgi:hypothetical protein